MKKSKIFAIAILTVIGVMVVGTCASQTTDRFAIGTPAKDTLYVEKCPNGESILSLWEIDREIITSWPVFVRVDNIAPIVARIERLELSPSVARKNED